MTDHYAIVNPEELQVLPQSSPGSVTCEICGKNFATSQALGVHFRSHGSNKVPCPDCGKEYHPGPGMSRHRQTAHGATKNNGHPAKERNGTHPGPPQYAYKDCSICGKVIRSKDMARHLRQVHPAPLKLASSNGTALEPLSSEDIFDSVIGLLFPRGSIPITALTPLLRWRHATDIMLEEIAK